MDSWEEKTFENCVNKIQNGLSKRSGSKGIPITVLRLMDLSDEIISLEQARTILLSQEECEKYILDKYDVIMIRVNGSRQKIAKQYLVLEDRKLAFCDHIIRLKYKQDLVVPEYMVLFSNTQYYAKYVDENMVSSAGQNTISRKGMSNLKIPVPVIDEQTEIIRIIDNLLAKEQQAHNIAQNALAKIDLIKKSILARAFRGQLATNNPDDEPAIELLKKVL